MSSKPLLHTQPITTQGHLPSRELVEIIQRLRDAITAGGGGSLADGNYGGVTVSGGGTVISLNNEPIDDRVAAFLTAGTNITLTYNDPANTLTISATGGGATGGTTVLDFGAAPGGNVASAAVTGQSGILSGSRVRAWIMGSNADHNAYEHQTVLPLKVAVTASEIVAGTGFTIYGTTDMRLTGDVSVAWEWA